MSSRSLVALLALVVVLVTAGVAGGVANSGPATGASTGGDASPPVANGDAPAVSTHTPAEPNGTREPATMTMRLQLQADGDARWRVSATYEFADDADAETFDDLAEDFENDEEALALDTLQLARENASAATGREMVFRNVERTSSRTPTNGTLTVAFTWTNFARVEGNRLYVGDAFNSTDGTWLPGLDQRQTLVIAPPEGYGVVSAPQVGIVDGVARWDGPHRFDGREPWIVYSGDASTATAGTTTTAPPTTGLTTTDPPTTVTTTPGDGGLSSVLPVALLVIVAGVGAAALAVYMRREDRPGPGGTVAGSVDDTGPGDGPDVGSGGESAAAGTAAADDPASGQAEAAGAVGDDDASADDAIDEELLSDEERVERLLERNGGRMKQANIVKETGWSNAKVSQLLSSMAEEDRVDKLRIGRENLISFPDEDVADLTGDDDE